MSNPDLDGKQLLYLIGADENNMPTVPAGLVVECPYRGLPYKEIAGLVSIGYCNLFDEENTGKYGPYLHDSDTASQYGEGQIDPAGPGWYHNLQAQFIRRKNEGFIYIELDNCDAYPVLTVLEAYSYAQEYGLKVIAKNPALLDQPERLVMHPNVYGIISEKGAGTPNSIGGVRVLAGKPNLWSYFVFFGKGKTRAVTLAQQAKKQINTGVSYSPKGEYQTAVTLQAPIFPEGFKA